MRKIIIQIIKVYQYTISPDHGILKRIGLIRRPVCAYYPTCSEYTKQAIEKYGALKGIYLGCRRILRCHPWQKKHFDPVR